MPRPTTDVDSVRNFFKEIYNRCKTLDCSGVIVLRDSEGRNLAGIASCLPYDEEETYHFDDDGLITQHLDRFLNLDRATEAGILREIDDLKALREKLEALQQLILRQERALTWCLKTKAEDLPEIDPETGERQSWSYRIMMTMIRAAKTSGVAGEVAEMVSEIDMTDPEAFRDLVDRIAKLLDGSGEQR